MSITSKNLIINNAGPKDNPRENEFYQHNTMYIDPPDFCSHVAWSITGDIPVGISIDAGSGVISGTVLPFFDQPSTQDNKVTSELEYNGSNFDDNGRYKNQTYDFKFTIKRDYLAKGSDGCNNPVPASETSDVFIKEVKCHNIDNLAFIKAYLESTKCSKLGKETAVNVNGVEYTDYNILKNNHPGPWTCPPK
jgi:hypothetical protein